MSGSMSDQPSEKDLLKLKGRRIPVLDLLRLFGARRREPSIVLVMEQALDAAGLTTIPSFATCGHQADVHIVAVTVVFAEESAPDTESTGTEDEEPAVVLPQHPLRVGDILDPNSGVVSLPPTAGLQTATHLMRSRNFSQLPVIEGQSYVRGVVTWKSIARMYEQNLPVSLASAMETDDLSVVEESQDFFALLPSISEKGYALVRRNDGIIGGIVTDADVTERFAATARPFFLAGEIEFRLRRCLGKAVSEEAIKAVQAAMNNKKTGQVSDLTFFQYEVLIDGQQQQYPALCAQADLNWAALKWGGLDRGQFLYDLAQVRKIRNKIAHFDPQPLPEERLQQLIAFRQLLREYVPDL